MEKLDQKHPIAYFSAEYGLDDNLPIFAGGLGILAADLFLGAGEENLPFVAIGLNYHKGFNTYRSNSPLKNSDPSLCGFNILKDRWGKPILINIKIEDHQVWLKVYEKLSGSAKLFLLDTDTDVNLPTDQQICQYLYDSDLETRIKQMLILGFGGLKLLETLKITPRVYHLNEGQTAFVSLALLLNRLTKGKSDQDVIVATKHTMLSGADLYLTKEQFTKFLGNYLTQPLTCSEEIFKLGQEESNPEIFSVTRFLLKTSCRASGVSLLHCQMENKKDPSVNLIPITNGVNLKRWLSSSWTNSDFSKFSNQQIWQIHQQNKQKMINTLTKLCQVNLNPEVLTIVWARRLAGYKRPGLIFSNKEILQELLENNQTPIQIIISGKASEADNEAKRVVDEILSYISYPQLTGKICYIPDYSLQLAQELVAGADVWLNTPEFGKEACGTSGMKAALNGVLQYSVADGWLAEVDSSDVGWVLPDGAVQDNFYNIIRQEIIPLFYKRDNNGLPEGWIAKMRTANQLILNGFLTKRVILSYMQNLYFP